MKIELPVKLKQGGVGGPAQFFPFDPPPSFRFVQGRDRLTDRAGVWQDPDMPRTCHSTSSTCHEAAGTSRKERNGSKGKRSLGGGIGKASSAHRCASVPCLVPGLPRAMANGSAPVTFAKDSSEVVTLAVPPKEQAEAAVEIFARLLSGETVEVSICSYRFVIAEGRHYGETQVVTVESSGKFRQEPL